MLQMSSKCDSWSEEFSVHHAVMYKKRTARPTTDGSETFAENLQVLLAVMCKEPLIRYTNDGITALKADLMIRSFRGTQLRGSFDIGVTNTDTKCDSDKTF